MFLPHPKKLLLLFPCFIWGISVQAQTETKKIINTAGQQGVGHYSISFGEPVVGTSSGAATGFLAPNDTLIVLSASTTPVANAYVQIFPNPVTTILTVQSNEEISKITLYNSSGQLLHTLQPTSSTQTTIDMSVYVAGTYLVQIVYGKALVPTVARIIKN